MALAGKRYFEALGRSDKSRKVPRSSKHYTWPQWAQQAYMRGRMLQTTNKAKVPNARNEGARGSFARPARLTCWAW